MIEAWPPSRPRWHLVFVDFGESCMANKILWYSVPSLHDSSNGAAIHNKVLLEALAARGLLHLPFGRLSLCCDAIKRAGIRRWDCPVGLSRPACGRSVVRRVLLVRGRRVGAYLPRSPLARRAHPARLLCMRLMDAGRGALGSVPRLLWGVACICGRRVHLAVRDAPSFRVCRQPKRGCSLSTGRRRAFNLIGAVVRDGGE